MLRVPRALSSRRSHRCGKTDPSNSGDAVQPTPSDEPPADERAPSTDAEPTSHRRRSTYSSDRVPLDGQTCDHLDMEAEVEALAWVTAAKDIDPPARDRAVRRLGNRQEHVHAAFMHERIEGITKEARAAPSDRQRDLRTIPPASTSARSRSTPGTHADANCWASPRDLHLPGAGSAGWEGADRQPAEYVELVHQLETTRSLREEAEQRQDAAREERARRIDELDGVRRSRHETAEALAAGTVDRKLVVRHRRPERAREVVSVVGGSVNAAELGEWLSIVLTDPEFLNKAVAAIPDELVRSRLSPLLEDAAFRERLAKAATSPVVRRELVEALVKGAGSGSPATDDVAQAGPSPGHRLHGCPRPQEGGRRASPFARQLVYLLRHAPLAIRNWRIAAVVLVGLAVAVGGVAAVLLNVNQVVAASPHSVASSRLLVRSGRASRSGPCATRSASRSTRSRLLRSGNWRCWTRRNRRSSEMSRRRRPTSTKPNASSTTSARAWAALPLHRGARPSRPTTSRTSGSSPRFGRTSSGSRS